MNRINNVVIAGVGAVNLHGVGIQEILKNKLYTPEFKLEEKNYTGEDLQIGYSKLGDIDTATYLPEISMRCIDKITIYTGIASSMVASNYISANTLDTSQVGMVLGTALGSIVSIGNFDLQSLREGPTAVHPMEFPNTVSNAPTSKVGIWFSLKGPSVTLSNGFTSGLDSVGYAFNEISYGKALCYLAGASEEISEHEYKGYAAAATSKAGIQLGEKPVEILGEGSGILLLCSADEAYAKGYKVYGRIVDFYSGKLIVDNRYSDTVRDIITAMLASCGIFEEEAKVYTSYLPFNSYSHVVCKKLAKHFGSERLVICNRVENTYINYLGVNGVFNLIYALEDFKGSDCKAAVVFDVGCNGKLSCVVIKP